MGLVDLPSIVKVECDVCGDTLRTTSKSDPGDPQSKVPGDIIVLEAVDAYDDIEGFDWSVVGENNVIWCRTCLRSQPRCKFCHSWMPFWPTVGCTELKHEARLQT